MPKGLDDVTAPDGINVLICPDKIGGKVKSRPKRELRDNAFTMDKKFCLWEGIVA